MKFIDPHIHCVSRTTDDYLYMSRAGVVAVSEPAFWAGFDRSTAASFGDYFRLLVGGGQPQELQIALDLLTTNETYFFREPKHFDFLRDSILPVRQPGAVCQEIAQARLLGCDRVA